MAPIYPIHKHDLNTGAYLDSKGVATTNPVDYVYDYDGTRLSDPGRDALVESLWNSRKFTRSNTNARTYITLTPIKGLNITSNYAIDLSDLRRKVFENPKVGDGHIINPLINTHLTYLLDTKVIFILMSISIQ